MLLRLCLLQGLTGGLFDINTALEEITKYKGSLYDTKIVDTCLKLFKERNFSFE